MMHIRIIALISMVIFGAPLKAEELRLVMVEEAGCVWCAEWNEALGPIYPKTEEGKLAPLRRVDIHDLPDDLDFARPVRFTPTFVLMRDGVETGRIDGYPGEDFFWGLLAELIREAGSDGAEG